MDKGTFGGTRAAEVLVLILDEIKNTTVTRSCSRKLQDLNRRMKEILNSGLSTHDKHWALANAHKEFKGSVSTLNRFPNVVSHLLNCGKAAWQNAMEEAKAPSGFFQGMTQKQFKWWNEGLDHHPNCLSDCKYSPLTEAYKFFEDGWWYADNE